MPPRKHWITGFTECARWNENRYPRCSIFLWGEVFPEECAQVHVSSVGGCAWLEIGLRLIGISSGRVVSRGHHVRRLGSEAEAVRAGVKGTRHHQRGRAWSAVNVVRGAAPWRDA